MRKFIIAIICSFFVCRSFAVALNYLEPTKSNYAEKWLGSHTEYLNELNKDPAAGGYGLLQSQLDDTSGDGISLWVASNIYEHGAKICQVQIRTKSNTKPGALWIDYHWGDDWECYHLCEPKYSGNECKKYDETVQCSKDYVFKSMYSLIDRTDDTHRHTKKMDVLQYINREMKGDGKAEHVVLAVTKKLTHGAKVSPVKIVGVGKGSISKIESVKSNGEESILCQEGYVANDAKNDCVKTTKCEINMDKMCDDYNKNDYHEDQHILKIKKEIETGVSGLHVGTVKTCTYFECKTGYVWKREVGYECMKCPTTAKQGIRKSENREWCEVCNDNQVFNTTLKKCTNRTPLTKEQLEHGINGDSECWMETGSDAYKECVLPRG